MKKFVITAALSIVAAVASTQAQAFTFDKEVPQAVRDQITQDLQFMGQMQGETASALHGQIFGGKIDGAAYVNFFDTRVKAVGMNGCGNGNAVACVIPFFDSSKIWLTQNYIKFSHPQVAKMMVVFHEARHTERKNGNWGHATCPTPFLDADGSEMKSIWTGATLAGEPACDVTPMGSYGSSSIMLKNIQKFCTNCTEKVRQDAGMYADDQFKRITDASAKEAMKKDVFGN